MFPLLCLPYSWPYYHSFPYFAPCFCFLPLPVIRNSVSFLSLTSHSQLVTFLSIVVSFKGKKKKSLMKYHRRRPWHGQFAVYPPPTLPDKHFTVAFRHKLGCLQPWYIFEVLCSTYAFFFFFFFLSFFFCFLKSSQWDLPCNCVTILLQHHLTWGSFNLQGLRTVVIWDGWKGTTFGRQICFLFFFSPVYESRAMRFQANKRTRPTSECITRQT